MNIMDLINKSKDSTTKDLFLGSPESEGETFEQSRVRLNEVYIVNESAISELMSEKFIIIGRKGSGKSALANFLAITTRNSSDDRCDFIGKDTINLRRIIDIAKEDGISIGSDAIFQWVVLTKVISLAIKDESLKTFRDIRSIISFLEKNKDFPSVDKSKLKQYLKSNGCNIAIEHLKRIKLLEDRNLIPTSKDMVPFHEVLPHLRELAKHLIGILASTDSKKTILVFVDDLDIGYDAKSDADRTALMDLLRVTKDLNRNVFGKSANATVKVVILLRDDIQATVIHESDAAKMFSSYGITLNWFADTTYKRNEDDLEIKKFINKRIESALKSKGIQSISNVRWEGFVAVNFKDLLDFTFYTPRDLLLFFLPIGKMNYEIPISGRDLGDLLNTYCDEAANEIRSLLGIHYKKHEIEKIFTALESRSQIDFSLTNLIESLDANGIANAIDAVKMLFNASIIGYVGADGFLYFKHREKPQELIEFSLSDNRMMTLHKAIKKFFINHRNHL